MESGWEAGQQKTPAGASLQGRDCATDRRSTVERESREQREEGPESRLDSSQKNRKTEDRARGIRGQVGESGELMRSRVKGKGMGNILESDKSDVLRILYTNARSIIGKIDILKTYVYDLKPSIVCISEACTNNLISDAFLSLDGYSLTVRWK